MSAGNSGKTATGRPFKPGESGNLNGRPKVVDEFRAKARKAVDELVLEKWIDEVRNMGDDWLRASELLAAYGYGKPSQGIEVSGKDGVQLGPLVGESMETVLAAARREVEKELLQSAQSVK